MPITNAKNELPIEPLFDGSISREKINQLQESMLPFQCEAPDPVHHFAPGVYLRELTIPKGMLVVGKVHKHNHMLLILKGRAEIVSEFGREIVESGHISMSKAGVKRVVLALEDTTFVCVHHNPDNLVDLDLIESEHIDPEPFSAIAQQEYTRLFKGGA